MAEGHNRAYRHPKYKTSYHVKNWSEYTVSRRNRSVNVCRCTRGLPDSPLYFIVESTGLKICGQGEWYSKKLHLGVDENGRILASKVTDGQEQNPSQVPDLLTQVEREIRTIRRGRNL